MKAKVKQLYYEREGQEFNGVYVELQKWECNSRVEYFLRWSCEYPAPNYDDVVEDSGRVILDVYHDHLAIRAAIAKYDELKDKREKFSPHPDKQSNRPATD